MRQCSQAQRIVEGNIAFNEWQYKRRQRRKKLFETGVITLDKSNTGVFRLKVKGWSIAVAIGSTESLRQTIDAVCDTIIVLEKGGLV